MSDYQNNDSEHEEHVQQYWRDAVIDFLRTKIERTRKGFLLPYYQIDLPLNESTLNTLGAFLAAHFDWTPDHAQLRIEACRKDALLKDSKVGLARGLGSIFYFLLLMCISVATQPNDFLRPNSNVIHLLSVLLWGLVLYIPVMALTNARAIARSRARRQYGNTPDVLEAYCDIQATGVRENLGNRLMVICGTLMLAACVGAVVLKLPPQLPKQISDTINRISWRMAEEELDELLLSDGVLTESGIKALDQSLNGFTPGSEEALTLAAYAQFRTDAGYPEAAAREALAGQIAAMDPQEYYSDSLIQDIMKRAPWTRETFFERFMDQDSITAKTILKKIAEYCQDEPLADRMERAKRITSPSMSAEEFVTLTLTADDMPRLGDLLTQTDDPEQAALYARLLTSNPIRPEDIVPVLYRLREQGKALKDLFPQGIALDMDLTVLNKVEIPDGDDTALNGSRYLVLSRTELSEMKDRFLMHNLPGEDYDYHDKNDPASFDVKIDTAALDRLPLEHLPAVFSDCDWLILTDTMYFYEDSISAKVASEMYFFPVFSCRYRLLLVEPEGFTPQRLLDSLTVDPLLDQKVNSWTNYGTGASMAYWQPFPQPDTAWIETHPGQFLDSLEQADWDIGSWAETVEGTSPEL